MLMAKAFWILAALDGLALLTQLTLGLNEKGHNDGGREMGLMFFVLLPLLILAGTCLAFAWLPFTPLRWLLLAVVALPASFDAYLGIAKLGLRSVNDPANGFPNPAMRDTVRAVSKLDVEGVRKSAPGMDKDIDQGRVDAPLRIVIQSMVDEIRSRVPAQTERHLEIVKILLENGAKPNDALEIACWTKSEALLRLLFQHGADPNFVNKYGSSAFLGCLGGGMVTGSTVPGARAFIEAGAHFKEPTRYGTPAKFALSSGSYDAALYLVEQGSDPQEEEFVAELRLQLGMKQQPAPELLTLAKLAKVSATTHQ
jgi:hypothetical protein